MINNIWIFHKSIIIDDIPYIGVQLKIDKNNDSARLGQHPNLGSNFSGFEFTRTATTSFTIPTSLTSVSLGNWTLGSSGLQLLDFDNSNVTNLLDGFCGSFMAQTSDEICKRKGVTREETDEFAALSHTRTNNSIQSGIWEQEIVDVEGVGFKDEDHVVPGCTKESLSELRTAFGPESLVTAGNASGVVDGAAAVIVKSASRAKKDGNKPLAKIVSWGIVGLEPAIMAYGPVPSSKLALEKAGLTIEDIDRWEINEAFAGQAVACIKDLGLDISKVNVNGGAVGLGHPLAATGTRLVLTLAHELKRSGSKYGVATACIGGGQGIAMVIESI